MFLVGQDIEHETKANHLLFRLGALHHPLHRLHLPMKRSQWWYNSSKCNQYEQYK